MIAVVPKLRSGFGNRLFQLSAALWTIEQLQASGHSAQLRLFSNYIASEPHDSSLNALEIIDLPEVISGSPQAPMSLLRGSFDDLERALKLITKTEQTIILEGYFQDHRYSESLRPYAMRFIHSLGPAKESAFLHVRIYEDHVFNTFKTDIAKYYQQCQAQAASQTFDVYSNDNAAATKILKNCNFKYTVIPKMSALETFENMVASSGGIISNSTFSWWAACFMQWKTPGVFVLIPSPWANMQSIAHVMSKFHGFFQPLVYFEKPEFKAVKFKSASHPIVLVFLGVLAVWLCKLLGRLA